MSGELSFFSIGAVVETSNVPGGIHGGDAGASPYLFFQVDDIDVVDLARVGELGWAAKSRVTTPAMTRTKSPASGASRSA